VVPPPAPLHDAPGVVEIVRAARDEGRFALDLEFLWERTYRPLPCLAQIAVGERIAIVDPLAGGPLEPVAELVADPDVATVMHAPSADLTLLALHFDVRPAALVDVQTVAGFVGLGASQSLATLLERALRIRLDKTESYSDWSRRPLTDAQLEYAADDVRYLLPLADALEDRARRLGRWAWVDEELERRYGDGATFTTLPSEAWRRIKGQGRLSGRDRAVLQQIAEWREREALRRDRPPAWVLPDRLALEIARRRPADRAALAAARGATERLRDSDVRGLLEAVQAGMEAQPIHLPAGPPPEMAARLDTLGALGQILVGARAGAAGLAAPLLATRDEIEAYLAAVVSGDADGLPLASGWRRELAGEALERLASGRLALAPDAAPPYIREVGTDPT
jgi:ribonuclease D